MTDLEWAEKEAADIRDEHEADNGDILNLAYSYGRAIALAEIVIRELKRVQSKEVA